MVETCFLSYHWKCWMNWKNEISCGHSLHASSPHSLEIHHYKVQNTGGCTHQHQVCSVCIPCQIICPYPNSSNAPRITLTYWCRQQYGTALSRNTNKMQLCNRIYYSKVYWRLNMFRAAHRLSSGTVNCVCSLWFIYPCGDRPLPGLSGKWKALATAGHHMAI